LGGGAHGAMPSLSQGDRVALKNPASSPESNCHGKVPAQGCNLTRDMIPRQEPRRNKRRDAFASSANHRFPAYWTREEDAFAQPWDYATAGPLWANPPFSCLEEVVTKAAREGCLMLVIAPEWPGPQYPWWGALCALCPKRWQLPQDRPVYLRGGART